MEVITGLVVLGRWSNTQVTTRPYYTIACDHAIGGGCMKDCKTQPPRSNVRTWHCKYTTMHKIHADEQGIPPLTAMSTRSTNAERAMRGCT